MAPFSTLVRVAESNPARVLSPEGATTEKYLFSNTHTQWTFAEYRNISTTSPNDYSLEPTGSRTTAHPVLPIRINH
jgi:hypothetical protein